MRCWTRTTSIGSSPERLLTGTQLGRYLDYCSELLSLTSKLAALYAQNLPDPVVIDALSEQRKTAICATSSAEAMRPVRELAYWGLVRSASAASAMEASPLGCGAITARRVCLAALGLVGSGARFGPSTPK